MPRTAPAVRAKNGLIAALLAACALGAANADAAMLTPQDLESAEVAAELLSMARESAAASIAGRMPKFANPLADLANASRNGVHVLLWRCGQPMGEGLARQSSLAGNIRVAAAAAVEKIDAASLAESILFLTIFGAEAQPNCPPLPSRLRRAVIVGENGVRAEYKGLETVIPPLTALQEGWDIQDLFEALARRVASPPDIKIDPVAEKSRLLSIIADPGFQFFVLPATIWASFPEDQPPRRFRRLGCLVRVEDIKTETIRAALEQAAAWIEKQIEEDGGLPGVYDLRLGKRQPAALRDQAAMAAAMGAAARITRGELRHLGRRILAKAMASYREDKEGKTGFLMEGEEADLGASAAALLALLRLDMAKGDQRPLRLAVFLKGMRHPQGRFELFYPPRETNPADTGYERTADAQVALLEWAMSAADSETIKWLCQGLAYDCERLDLTQDLRITPGLARVCSLLGVKQASPAMVDLVLKASAIIAATQQARPAVGEVFAADAAGCFVDRKGGGYEVLEAGAAGRVVEGLACAYALAKAKGDQRHKDALRRAALLGARYLLQLQIRGAEDAILFAAPAAAAGAFRVSPERPLCRLADHAACISALVAIHQNFGEDDYGLPTP